ncbi:MAG TPA: serine hydrolase domain-containing protein, partial [Iamia sp.]|nr:serine hydrolase domain-containing protein [Iamia sp.]
MTPVGELVVEDLSTAPDPRFRPILDTLARLVADDPGRRDLEVVVQCEGVEALRARIGSAAPTAAPLVAVCGSAFKPVVALALLQVLHDAGIDPDEPLAPHGVHLADGGTTGRHVIDHRAGLPQIRDLAPEPAGLADGAAIVAALRRTPPIWEPGIRSAYHAISYGYLVEAVISDLTGGGTPMADLVRDRVLRPAGVRPDEVALPWSTDGPEVTDLFVTGQSPIPWRPQGRSLIYRATYALPDLVDHLNRAARGTDPPLSCGVPCTASALAGLYGALIAPSNARPGLPDEVRVARATPSAPGFDQVLRQRLTWSGGTLVGAGLRRA